MSDQPTYTVTYIPTLKGDKKFRRWWNGRRQTKAAQAWFAVQEGIKLRGN